MISTPVLGALRVAATLTHGLPGLRCRLRVDDRTVVLVDGTELSSEPAGGPDTSCPVTCSPCGFRAAVADAHLRHGRGEQLQLLDLAAQVEPTIDIGTPAGGTARPGGLYRAPIGGRWLWAFATTLDADDVHRCCQELLDEARFEIDVEIVGVRWDPATEVSLVYAETTASPGSPQEADVIELVEACLARVTAVELLLAAGAMAPSNTDSPSEAELRSGERGA